MSLLSMNDIYRGDVVQIHPDIEHYGYCFLIVTDLDWEYCCGYVIRPASKMEYSTQKFLKMLWQHVTKIGKAAHRMDFSKEPFIQES